MIMSKMTTSIRSLSRAKISRASRPLRAQRTVNPSRRINSAVTESTVSSSSTKSTVPEPSSSRPGGASDEQGRISVAGKKTEKAAPAPGRDSTSI